MFTGPEDVDRLPDFSISPSAFEFTFQKIAQSCHVLADLKSCATFFMGNNKRVV